ncbi:MAG: PAS domain S-box protein [Desulfobacterales bacterium]|jgi:histidine kinase|nr:PAS domain S-box protein [Desulfobacterales bacterium]
MIGKIKQLSSSFFLKVIMTVGITLFCSLTLWIFLSVRFQRAQTTEHMISSAEKLATTIRLGTRYAMMLNAREDLNQIIRNVSRQEDLKTIRIYNKKGEIKFSSHEGEINRQTNIRAEACDACHRHEPPLSVVDRNRRVRFFTSEEGVRMLGVIAPIYNEPGCSADACHFHPENKSILGALDVVVSLEKVDAHISEVQQQAGLMAVLMFVVTSALIFILVIRFIRRPIQKLIQGTAQLTAGRYETRVDLKQSGELGQLADAINLMGETIGKKEAAIHKQRDDYQRLFEMVPCIITVQDRNFRLISYNRQFAEKFNPKPGAYCYAAYKCREEKCESCPVERTFADGLSHHSQETAYQKDGTARHWIVRTAPIRNAEGEIIAAIEMSIDITHRKLLQHALEQSEKKYYAIFNNVPNPIFVLTADTLEIIDCNDLAVNVYGYSKSELQKKSFMSLFRKEDRNHMRGQIKAGAVINQTRQIDKNGNARFFSIRVSPSDYPGKPVLLVTTSDITQWLETEQQLIQAGKMATLGEMATGVAHELNQPLSVIKTAGSYFIKKIRNKEPIKDEILETLAEEIDSHVDRATKIINHMRQFGRKSTGEMEPVHINEILLRAFEIFKQQLQLRQIDVGWELAEGLPEILGDAGRLEQVFINLLINARDAIEDRFEGREVTGDEKKITLRSQRGESTLWVEIQDTGVGIDPFVAERVFEPFFTTKKVGKGTGLGLSISYGIVKDCGGEIFVVPTTQGACFRLTFPIPPKIEDGDAP